MRRQRRPTDAESRRPSTVRGLMVAIGSVLLLPGSGAVAQVSDAIPVSAELRRVIRDELSGQVALDHVWQLGTFDRSTTDGYNQSIEYVRQAAEKAGLEDVRVIRFPADGKSRILDSNTASWAWRLGGGSLTYADSGEQVCRYLDVPTCIVKDATGVDADAELIDVGTGIDERDWAGKDVKGKLVLASAPAADVFAFAEGRFPILGVVSYWGNYLPDRAPFPDQVAWQSVPYSPRVERVAFSISARMAAELERRLGAGPVKLHARIDSDHYVGEYEVLTAAIPGRELTAEEIVVVSHLNHYRPGANDNASGSALSLELGVVLRRLVARNLLQPRGTIRFLWVGEHRGTQIFLHLDRGWGKRGIAVFSNDMVGADQAESGSVFVLTRTPDYLPSYLPDLVAQLLAEVAREQFRSPWGSRNPFHFRQDAYNGVVSDHAHFVDSSVAVPAIMLSTDPDNFYHSNEDTPDHIDATTLMRAGYTTAAAVSFLADAGPRETIQLAQVVSGAAVGRIGAALAAGLNRVVAAGDPLAAWAEEDNRLRHLGGVEMAAVRSVRRLGTSEESERRITWLADALRDQIDRSRELLRRTADDEARAKGVKVRPEEPAPPPGSERVPVRKLVGVLRTSYFLDALDAERRAWYQNGPLDAVRCEAILNYADGHRTVAEIRDEVAGALGATDVGSVLRYLEDLASIGAIGWDEKTTP